MRFKLIHLLTGLFLIIALVQCKDSITVSETVDKSIKKPSLIAPENESKQSLSLSFDWEQLTNADAYQIRISTEANFASTIVDSIINSAGFQVRNLPHDTTFFWKVRGVTNKLKGPWSPKRQFSTVRKTKDSSPISTDLQQPTDGSSTTLTNVDLKWTAVFGASSYKLQISTDEGFNTTVVDRTIVTTFFQPSSLEAQTTYYWRVKPILSEGNTAWSSVYEFITQEESPRSSSVSLVSPRDKAILSTTPTFEWQAINDSAEYHIQIATSQTFSSPVADKKTTELSFSPTGLESNQTYYWRVQTTNGTENWSAIRSFQTETATTDPTGSGDFVTVSNADFVLNGRTFRFAGTNAYYLPNYQHINPNVVDKAFDAFEEAGITVVRTYGFYDGPPQYSSDISMQPQPGVYNEEGLRRLDEVIAKAKEHGIRLIVVFMNNWKELGGVPQYNQWDGNAGAGMSHFINDPDTQRWFKNYISMLTNRTNTVTGVKYKNDPTIFAWEIMGEGRLPSGNPATMRDWYQDIAQHIKKEDQNHMVATGEEGFDAGTPGEYSVSQYSNTFVLHAGLGTSYKMNTAIPEIDYGTAHWYPEVWGLSASEYSAQHAWMSDHANIAEQLGKPFVMGEYGHDNGFGSYEQLSMYKDFWDYAESINLDGSLVWQFTAGNTKCYEFGGNICWPGARQDQELYNGFRNHIQFMNTSK